MFLIGNILVDSALLGILIVIFARHNATNDLFNRVAVVVGVTIGSVFLQVGLGGTLGAWILVLQILLTGVLLTWLVGTNPAQTAIIVVLFFVIKIALRVGLIYVLGRA